MQGLKKYALALSVVALGLSASVAAAADAKVSVGENQAVAIAINKAGGGSVLELSLDKTGGSPLYNALIVDNNIRHDVTVDAQSGEVVAYAKRDVHGSKLAPRGMAGRIARLDSKDVEPAALQVTGGGAIARSDLKTGSAGNSVYEIEIINSDSKYIVEVNANTGEVVQYAEYKIGNHQSVALAN